MKLDTSQILHTFYRLSSVCVRVCVWCLCASGLVCSCVWFMYITNCCVVQCIYRVMMCVWCPARLTQVCWVTSRSCSLTRLRSSVSLSSPRCPCWLASLRSASRSDTHTDTHTSPHYCSVCHCCCTVKVSKPFCLSFNIAVSSGKRFTRWRHFI